jgi:adenylate cyclase class 2
MRILNFEFKAKTTISAEAEKKLQDLDPEFGGKDVQTDTYFNVKNGRLKLREGIIENALIWYERADTSCAKRSDVLLYKCNPEKNLKDILIKSMGIKVIVNKKRTIYFIDNVKIHFDVIKELGTFIEVEAIDTNEKFGIEKLKEQCDYFAKFFEIKPEDYISVSYSDLILENSH